MIAFCSGFFRSTFSDNDGRVQSLLARRRVPRDKEDVDIVLQLPRDCRTTPEE